MNFYSYFALSTLVVGGVVAHACVAHEQFYPAVVHLSTDKLCLAVMYNFGFALFLLFGKLLLRIFIGTLRDLEVEQLVDSGRGFLADTILFLVFYAPTIDNKEVGNVYLIQYICCVIFMKVFHLTTQIRVSHMFEVGIPRLIVNIKLVSLMCFLLFCDVMALRHFYGVASQSSTFFTWILFEALTMSSVVLVSMVKYAVHMVDLRLESGWPGKQVCLFYIDLAHDVASMTLFLVFMLTFFVQNPSRLPIYMMADIIQVARKLAQRLRSFRRYRRISLNMDMRFPDATDDEIEHDEHCVICRESLFDGSRPKKLCCNHIFHIDCLRSWLVMQQVCPTCRAEISADAAPPAAGAAPAQTAPADAAQGAPPDAADDAPAAPAASPTATAAAAAAAAAAVAAAGGPATEPTPTTAGGRAEPDVLPPAAASPAAAPKASPAASPCVCASPAVASPVAAPQPPQLGAGAPAFAAAPGDGAPSALPPLQGIVETLRHADEVARFLCEQREAWMQMLRVAGDRPGAPAEPLLSAAGPSPGGAEPAPQANGAGAADPLAEIRRLQQERWRRSNAGEEPRPST